MPSPWPTRRVVAGRTAFAAFVIALDVAVSVRQPRDTYLVFVSGMTAGVVLATLIVVWMRFLVRRA